MVHTIETLLAQATTKLQPTTSTPALDAEVLLAYLLKKHRSYLYAHSEQAITDNIAKQYVELIIKHQQGMPIAYITGTKEFWSLNLHVDPSALIPRPETELLVELTLQQLPATSPQQVADLGTGSGAIAIALAHDCPQWQLYGTELNPQALKLARKNAKTLGITNVEFLQGSWCQPLPNIAFNAIVANPPYIDANDPALEQVVLRYEPRQAVIAEDHGLAAIEHIAKQAWDKLKSGGVLLMEHGYQQRQSVANILAKYRYRKIHCYQDLSSCDRVSGAVK